jgi:hypothetical protein
MPSREGCEFPKLGEYFGGKPELIYWAFSGLRAWRVVTKDSSLVRECDNKEAG